MVNPQADLKLAARVLRRSPLFTAMAVASLGLGIGANTAIFTLVDQLLLRLLPVRDPQQLVMIWSTGPHMGSNRGARASSYPMYQDFQKRSTAFSYVFCEYSTSLSVSIGGHTERVEGELVSGNYFQALGVRAAEGRVFTPELDDREYKGHPSVVLSYPYWVTRFAADPGVVGRKMLVNNYPMTIVGVSAPGFQGLDPASSPQIRVPIQMKPLMTPGWDQIGDRRSQWIHMFARLKPGYSIETARASLQPLFLSILQDELKQKDLSDVSNYLRSRFLKRQVQMESAAAGYSQLRRSYATALIALMCMVGLVLLIACFNVANLLIARAGARQKELAVRVALGASRAEIVRQLLTESLLLAAMGCVAGIFLSIGMVRGLLSFLPTGDSPLMLSANPDLRILAFAMGAAALAAVLFGLAPALRATRLDLWGSLKDVVGSIAGSSGSARLRKSLVTAQVAFSFLLLAGAGLFVKTLANLKSTRTGFGDLDNLITFQVDPGLNGYSQTRINDLYTRALENIRALPGVKSAAYTMVPLLAGDEWDSSMSVEGHVNKDGEDIQAFMNGISPGYWQTMGLHLLEGRDFDDRDRTSASADEPGSGDNVGSTIRVAIVNREFATHFFGNRSAIGRHIGFGGQPGAKLPIEIVGVTDNSLYEGPRDGVHRQVFVPFLETDYPASVAFYVRTSVSSEPMFASLRRTIAGLDPALPVYGMKTMDRQLDETLGAERLIATLSAAFGALTTLLAAMGIYGVMAFVVSRRTKEIGLRMALGAQRADVVRMVVLESLLPLGVGLGVGVPAAYWLSRYVASQLFGVKPTDGATVAAAVAILAAAALAASLFPAKKASAIDPMQALRYE
ncbi:MAG TPA: ABC transporter permease [Bryobacteraceae bacterium]|nr:ABC transporter permease [Bryobacteraceae bacterium]